MPIFYFFAKLSFQEQNIFIMIKTAIKNLAEIISGFPFRNVGKDEFGDTPVIKARDINGDVYLNIKDCVKVSSKGFNTRAIVKNGDLLVSQKSPFSAGVASDDCVGSLADFSTFVLRNISKEADPEYLAAFFNSKEGKNNTLRAAKGSIIKSVSKKELEEIEIPVPSLEKQKLIVEVYKNNLRQQKLLDRKKELVGQVVESAIKQILTNQNI